MSHWTEKLIDFCKFDSMRDQNETNEIKKKNMSNLQINQSLPKELLKRIITPKEKCKVVELSK
jgi:hypothetical protein